MTDKTCPICGAERSYYEDKMDHIVLEWEWTCPKCRFYESFVTGNYQVVFPKGKKELYWSYTTKLDDLFRIQKIIDKLIKRYKHEQFSILG